MSRSTPDGLDYAGTLGHTWAITVHDQTIRDGERLVAETCDPQVAAEFFRDREEDYGDACAIYRRVGRKWKRVPYGQALIS